MTARKLATNGWMACYRCSFPSSDRIPSLPHIPDGLSHGAASCDWPRTSEGAIARLLPTTSTAAYEILNDPNPGSATLIRFGGEADWQTAQFF